MTFTAGRQQIVEGLRQNNTLHISWWKNRRKGISYKVNRENVYYDQNLF